MILDFLANLFGQFWADVEPTLQALGQSRSRYQISLILGCFVFAHLINMFVGPRADAWMHSLQGMQSSQLRFIIAVGRRTRAIIFVILLWVLALFVREVTPWGSWYLVLFLAANLATAWVVVGIASRVIRNNFVRKFVRWGAWIYLALYILGMTDAVVSVLDAMALSIGQFRLSFLMVLKAAITVVVLLSLVSWISSVVHRRLEKAEEISPSIKVLTDKMVKLLLYGIAIMVTLQSVGFDLTSITVLSGAIGLGLGFGLQKVVSNLVSGVILLLDKSIKPGDVISLGETFGWISDLGARYVSVVTRDGREYLIPNEDLITGQVVNWSHSSDLVRLDINFGVSYDSDPHEVRKISREAAASVSRVVNVPAPVCHIIGFGDSAIDLILRFWIKDPTGGLTNVRGDVFLALWDALKENGIEIPFPHQVQVYPKNVHPVIVEDE